MFDKKSLKPLLIKLATMGTINIQTGKLIIKDPLTGMGNLLKQGKDFIFQQNFDQGVWIGKKVSPNKSWGYSSYLTENNNMNLRLEYIVKIDGKKWGLDRESGEIVQYRQDEKQFQWYYKGKTICQVEKFIEGINREIVEQNYRMLDNINIAKSLYFCARGLIDENQAYQFLFTNNQ